MGIQLVESEVGKPITRQVFDTNNPSLGKRLNLIIDTIASDAQKQSDEGETLSRLRRLGVSVNRIAGARRNAYLNGSTLVGELIANNEIDEATYYRCLARDLKLEFVENVDPSSLILSDTQSIKAICRAATVRCLAGKGATFALTAPSEQQISILTGALRCTPTLAALIRITTPKELERAVLSRLCRQHIRDTVNALPLDNPEYSAKEVLTSNQGFILGAMSALLPVLTWIFFKPLLLAVHILASLLFAGCVLLRVRAASLAKHTAPQQGFDIEVPEGPYPIYTVMVALYKEAEIVPQLCEHLSKLNWPASRLEVLFLCEEADAETIHALATVPQNGIFRTILIPKFGPQTKPRALSFALPLAKGEFVVVYDAEDRPHPDQLMEAYVRFQRAPVELACLQSPLLITNGSRNMLARMFAFEYSALFSGLLPYLANGANFLPLGGTSNHFRRTVLMKVGKWDPYNVTEDADLGTRLVRHGYRTGMLNRPTLEDAPTNLRQWLPQRTRWFKGWIQTWLVHMRQPRKFYAQIGRTNFVYFQLLTVGMVLSALIYPIMLLEMTWHAASIVIVPGYNLSTFGLAIFAVDFANVALGHLGFILLGSKASAAHAGFSNLKVALALPFYWTLLSVAAWRAVWQLFRAPHFWEKTQHFPTE